MFATFFSRASVVHVSKQICFGFTQYSCSRVRFLLASCLFSFNSRVTTSIALWPSPSGPRVVSIPVSEMLPILLEMLHLISAVGCASIRCNDIIFSRCFMTSTHQETFVWRPETYVRSKVPKMKNTSKEQEELLPPPPQTSHEKIPSVKQLRMLLLCCFHTSAL